MNCIIIEKEKTILMIIIVVLSSHHIDQMHIVKIEGIISHNSLITSKIITPKRILTRVIANSSVLPRQEVLKFPLQCHSLLLLVLLILATVTKRSHSQLLNLLFIFPFSKNVSNFQQHFLLRQFR